MRNSAACLRLAAIVMSMLSGVTPVAHAQPPAPSTVEATDFFAALYRPLIQDLQAGGGPSLLTGNFGSAVELNALLVAEVINLPTASNAGGFSWTYDSTLGTWGRSLDSFGPQFVERANTSGRNKVNFGFSYERFTFDHLQTKPLSEAAVEASGDVGGGAPAARIHVDERAAFSRADIGLTTLFVNYGITSAIDAGVFFSTMSIALEGSLQYTLRRGSPSLQISRTVTASGRSQLVATPIFRGKWNFLRRPRGGLTVALDGKPHGSTILGAGGLKLQIIATGTARDLHAHLNVGAAGYECDGPLDIKACRNVGGPFVVGGLDKALSQRLTLSADVQAQKYDISVRANQTSLTGGPPDITDPTILARTTRVTAAATARFNVWGNLLVTATALTSTNSQGLSDRFTPVVGFDYAW
jgi:hypothetical protein